MKETSSALSPETVWSLVKRWQAPPAENADLALRGTQYLQEVRRSLAVGDLVAMPERFEQSLALYYWLGQSIHRLNRCLNPYLVACQSCFYPYEQPQVAILAVPLSEDRQIDGFCQLATHPHVLMVDVSRVPCDHWLEIVVHEYAHAVVGSPGHDQNFRQVLTRLCLGLGLCPPPQQVLEAEVLAQWPPYPRLENPSQFWAGQIPWHC